MEETQTVDIIEPVTPPTPEPQVLSRDEAKDKGWGAKELESGEKRGMIAKPDEVKKAEPESKAPAAEAPKAEEKPKEEMKPRVQERRGTPLDGVVLTTDQEKVFLDTFGPGTPLRAVYFRMKNERAARQSEKQGREAAEMRVKELEERLTKETVKPKEIDEDGNVIDPEETPLTVKGLKALREQERAEEEKKQKALNDQARVVANAQRDQEDYARELYPDFDDTVGRVGDLLKNMETYVPEPWKQAKIRRMAQELQVAAANADKIDMDDYHAALIAYELGQLHPKYGQKADSPTTNGDASDNDGKSNDPKKGNGTLTPEQMKRIADNTQRRASSASVSGGGGKRTISVDDVDASTLNNMSSDERLRFKKDHPLRYAKLLRG